MKRHPRKNFHLSTNGDTIIEVIICLAIVGLALSISYSTANRSLLGTRTAHENSQAAYYVEQQIEMLRSISSDPNNQIFSQTKYFCVDPSSNSLVQVNATNSSELTTLNNSVYPNVCIQPNSQPLYYIAISPVSAYDTFAFTAHWYDVSGTDTDSVTYFYRIHTSPAALAAAQKDGTASVTKNNGGCAFTPCRGPGSPGATYHWGVPLLNNTDPSEAPEITGCQWDFGDGRSASNVACLPGDILRHVYSPPAGWPAGYNPNLCNTVPELVTLTLTLSRGTSPTDRHAFMLPECY